MSEHQPDLDLLLLLRRHILSGDEIAAYGLAKVLTEDMMSKMYPEVKEADPMLYAEVVQITAPIILERARKVLFGEGCIAS